MIAIVVDHCAECPLAMDDAKPWLCDANQDDTPREIPEQHVPGQGWPPPPDWCPLRTADRLVTIRRPR